MFDCCNEIKFLGSKVNLFTKINFINTNCEPGFVLNLLFDNKFVLVGGLLIPIVYYNNYTIIHKKADNYYDMYYNLKAKCLNSPNADSYKFKSDVLLADESYARMFKHFKPLTVDKLPSLKDLTCADFPKELVSSGFSKNDLIFLHSN